MANVLRHFRLHKKKPQTKTELQICQCDAVALLSFPLPLVLNFYGNVAIWKMLRLNESSGAKLICMCCCGEGGIVYSLRFPLGMYTLPDGVRTKHDGSKSTPKSFGLLATAPAIKRALFMRLIVGLRGGTSGGAVGVTPSRRKPAKREYAKKGIETMHKNKMYKIYKITF